MNKTLKLCFSSFLTVSIIFSSVLAPVMAANPTGTKSIYADFEGMTTVGQTTSAYGASTSINQKDTWKSKIEPALTSDAYGTQTTALHLNWYDTGSGSGSGWDTMWNISNLDISTSSVLNFDVKLDTAKSQSRLQYRYKKPDGNFSTFTLMHLNGTSGLTLLGKTLTATPIANANIWYNITIELSYNSTNDKLTGSAWVNGTKYVDETTSELTYNQGVGGISGVTGNFLRFVGYWNDTIATAPSGIWVDNIMFSQKSPYCFSSSPASGEKITGNTAKLVYPVKLDGNTLSDASGFSVRKDGEVFSPESITIRNNVIGVKLTNEEQAENGEYTINLPNGAKDIRGIEIPQSARTLTFRSGDPIIKSFSLVSPSDGLVIEKDKEFIIKAASKHIDGAEVKFMVNDEELTDVTSLSDGTHIAKWTPSVTGSYTIKATASHGDDNFVSESKNIKVLGNSAYTSNWRNISANSNPTEMGDGTEVANGYTVLPVIFKRTQDSAPYTKIYNSSVSTGYSAGFIVAEAEVTFSPSTGFNIYNRNAGENKGQTAFAFSSNGKIYYYNGTTSADSNIEYDQTKKHHIKTVWDLSAEKIYLILDGEQLPVVTTMRSDWLNVYEMRFNCGTAKSDTSNELIIENERLTYYPPNPEAESGAFSNGSFEIIYNVSLKETSINIANVKLYRGSDDNAPIDARVELKDNKIIKITPESDAMLVSSAEYRAELSGDIMSAEGAKANEEAFFTFRTAPSSFEFSRLGSTITSLSAVSRGDTITFSLSEPSLSTSARWVVMVLCGETPNGRAIKDISIENVTSQVSSSLAISSDITEGDVIFAYVIDGTFSPISDEFYLKY